MEIQILLSSGSEPPFDFPSPPLRIVELGEQSFNPIVFHVAGKRAVLSFYQRGKVLFL